jgi:hypothetical protein
MDEPQPMIIKDDQVASVDFGDIPASIPNRGGNNPNGNFNIVIE